MSGSDVQVVSFQKQGFWDVGGFFHRILRCVREFRPTVVHGYMDTGNIVSTWVRPFAPRARIVWGVRGCPRWNGLATTLRVKLCSR